MATWNEEKAISTRKALRHMDSEGRTLTASQAEFFENSKCRDAWGRLLVCYHGSPNKFDTFKKSKIGSTTDLGMYGTGFYFGDKVEVAQVFGTVDDNDKVYIYRVYLNLENPFIVDSAEADKAFEEMLFANTDEALEKDGIDPSTVDSIIEVDSESLKAQLMENTNAIAETYDGVIATYNSDPSNDSFYRQYVAFSPEQVKFVSNDDPTEAFNMKEFC